MLEIIQDALRLRRTIEVTVSIPLAIAQQNIHEGLHNDLILSKKWQMRRRYWGDADLNRVCFFGPKANEQFCFHTHRQLTGNKYKTRFLGTMRLRNVDFIGSCARFCLSQ